MVGITYGDSIGQCVQGDFTVCVLKITVLLENVVATQTYVRRLFAVQAPDLNQGQTGKSGARMLLPLFYPALVGISNTRS